MLARFRALALSIACAIAGFTAQAQSTSVEVTVSYRERIALPPDARLFVKLHDMTPSDAAPFPLATQLYAMTSVPMTVSLTYDPAMVDAERDYSLTAVLLSGDSQRFLTLRPVEVLRDEANGPVEIVLSMVEPSDALAAPPRTITGVRWVATEVLGAPWTNDDPATLTVDETSTFSIFGGCNRFTGQLQVAAGQIAFPEDFAGTLMACPTDVEDQERTFLTALARASVYVRYGAGLVLMDDMGNGLLHFEEHLER